jgi:diamine N-acetyltransferase
MPDVVTLRALIPDDVENLAALAHDIWHRHYPAIISREQINYMLAQRYSPALIRAQLGETDHGWWVVEVNGNLAGFAHASLLDNHCKLDKLYVHPDYQHRGFGAALLKHVRSFAIGHGKHRLILQVNLHNALALSAYRKYGFSIIESRVCDIGGGYVMDDYFMELTL